MTSSEQPVLPEWQQYPTFGEILVDPERFRDLRKRCHQSCEQIDRLLRGGSPAEKEAAGRSLEAYGRALQFLDEVLKVRDATIEKR